MASKKFLRKKMRKVPISAAAMGSNADQFAAAGNPWISERDREEMKPDAPKPARRASPKPTFHEKQPDYYASEKVELRLIQLRISQRLQGLLGSRTVAVEMPKQPAPVVQKISREGELDRFSNEYLAAERKMLAERAASARAEADRVKQASQQAKTDKLFADYAKAMAKAI